jgi:two-component system, chemotaxis family, chemotaxis protein CheY
VKKRKVLFVDDSSTTRKIIRQSLQQANLNVGDILEASNGREAPGMVERFTFDLILTDIDMPLMDGLELLEALAYVRSAQGIPVVVITKHTSREGVLRAMEAGARAYIRKPFAVKDLSEKIEPLLLRKTVADGNLRVLGGSRQGCFKGYPGGYFSEREPLTRGQHGFSFLDGPPGSHSPREVLHGFVNPGTNDFAA